jgi:trans-2,3-dihydro-3-hydroxyanthranilate isomerase
MPTFPFMQVDAFTDRPLSGNPCAILFDTDEMDSETMLAVAREMNLSETSFVRNSQIADFGARFFTPAEEIPLAGHPTIATTFALVDSGRLKITDRYSRITLELQAGIIPVDIFADEGNIQHIVMSQQKPRFLSTYAPETVMKVFGLTVDDAMLDFPLQTVSTGTPQLMIPVRNLDVLQRIQVDIEAYSQLRSNSDFFSPHLFCLEGVTKQGKTFARHFGMPPDTPEDPFTGSATGGMAAYLWRYGLIEEPTFTAEQGHWMNRPGVASVEVIGPRDDIITVKVGGAAVAVLHGEIMI